MKKISKLIVLSIVCVFLTGCQKNVLETVYNNMQINSKTMNGYKVNINLIGTHNDQKIDERIIVNNYLNKNYKVETNNNIYYEIDDKKYISNNDRLTKRIKEPENYDGEIPFIKTIKYVEPLKYASIDDKKQTDRDYDTYTFKVRKAEKLLSDTKLENEVIKNSVYAKVWIDSDNYIYKIEYDFTSAFENKENLKMTVYFSNINNMSDISLDSGELKKEVF